MEELSLVDYWNLLKRQKRLFLTVAGVLFLCSLVFTFTWSNYRSSATVEVAQPEIAPDTTTLGQQSPSQMQAMQSMADMMISRIQQKVLATGSLVEIITKLNLYPSAREYTPIAEIAEKMRKKIKIELVSSSLANPAASQKASAGELAAIAFTLSFDYKEPLIAQQTTNELVSRFLDEDLKNRRTQAKETSAFLGAQIEILEKSLVEQEKKIAEFRTANGDMRPDALIFNQQASTSILMNLQNVESQITSNEGTQGVLRAQLATTEPYSRIVADGQILTTPSVQLRALKSQYATLSAKYGANHPDVVKTARQIEALEAQVGTVNETAPLKAKITDVRTTLAAAQKAHGPQHPDVVSLQSQLKKLEDQLAAQKTKGFTGDGIRTDADNPAYLQLVAQLQSSQEQHKSLAAQRESLRAQLEKFQRAVADNPAVEQQLAALSRDYDNAQMRYRELKAKKMEADMSETVEQERSGQRLVVIDPPDLPLKTQPARILFLLAGLVFSFLGGIGAVLGHQLLRQTVLGPRHLESLVGVAPLVSVPHLVTIQDVKQFDRKRLQLLGVGIIAGLIALALFSTFVMPLDVLWAVIARRLGLY